jgi:hypothetical protein
MLATLDMIKREYGSVESLVVDNCLLTTEEIRRIRKNLVADGLSASDR